MGYEDNNSNEGGLQTNSANDNNNSSATNNDNDKPNATAGKLKTTRPIKMKFKGETEGMNGHMFQTIADS